jgi:hypothetical protein
VGEVLVEDPADAAVRQAPAVLVQQERGHRRRSGAAPPRGKNRPTVRQVVVEGCHGRPAEQGDPLLAALAAPDARGPLAALLQAEVRNVERDQLTGAHAGSVQDLEQGPVAEAVRARRVRRVEQRADLRLGQEAGQRRPATRRTYPGGRIVRGDAAPLQEREKGTESGRLARERRRRSPPGVRKLGEERPDQFPPDVSRGADAARVREPGELRQVFPVSLQRVPAGLAYGPEVRQKNLDLVFHRHLLLVGG